VADKLSELIPDADRREEILRALGRRFDDAYRRLVGAIGEKVVVARAREELEDLGYPDLARAVRHVSLETDQAGYDVSAPRVTGRPRLLEVKATNVDGEEFVVYLSRNEAEMGARFDEWALVVCRITNVDDREGEIVGWCTGRQVAKVLPADSPSGRWQVAALTISKAELIPGIPGAVG
jgi:hypothetical protein